MSRIKDFLLVAALASIAAAPLAGCGGGLSDLKKTLDEKKKRPGSHIEPLPQMRPYESFTYDPTGLRSPFQPGVASAGAGGVRPDVHRNREFLEGFSLDTLKMVGTLQKSGTLYGLVQTKDGLIHRVVPGNYIGQNDGKITSITTTKIDVLEIVPDGMGAYVERHAAITLANY
jgi:type IV pilus assembly protein PilP